MASDGPNVMDNIKTMSSVSVWAEQAEDVLNVWAADAQKRQLLHDKAVGRLRSLRFVVNMPLILLCFFMAALSLSFSSESAPLPSNQFPTTHSSGPTWARRLNKREVAADGSDGGGGAPEDTTDWLRTAASYVFLAVALGQCAQYMLDISARAERHLNFANRYQALSDEVTSVIKAPYSIRPAPDAFMARIKTARVHLHRYAPDVAWLSVSHFVDVFLEIDRDGDGRLSVEELRRHLKKRGTEKDAESVFEQLDVDHNGTISVKELRAAYSTSDAIRKVIGPIHGGA